MGKTKLPWPPEVVFDEIPVPTCVAVTSALATTAPLASVTVPLMLPSPCADKRPGMQMHSAKTATKQPSNLGKTLILPPKALLLRVESIVSCPFHALNRAQRAHEHTSSKVCIETD